MIEPSAGADRAALAFFCEAYAEDEKTNREWKDAETCCHAASTRDSLP